VAVPLRLRTADGHWFGPVFFAAARVIDPDLPRKLVAHRGARHVKVQWFAPQRAAEVASYELFRAEGREGVWQLRSQLAVTELVDRDVKPDPAYYYRVVAVRRDGSRSRPSIADNARAASRPRLFDAEVLEHSIPARVGLGELVTCRVKVQNTGTRAWDPGASRLAWSATQLWGEDDELKLPRHAPGESGAIEPGQTATFEFAFAAPRPGRFENHWILTLDPPARPRAYFGTPLLVETTVDGAEGPPLESPRPAR
jgi:hypothetical protein